jgi:hypothetical protein
MPYLQPIYLFFVLAILLAAPSMLPPAAAAASASCHSWLNLACRPLMRRPAPD